MRNFCLVTSLLLLFDRCQATDYLCPGGSYVQTFGGRSGDALDYISSMYCSGSGYIDLFIGGTGGGVFASYGFSGPYSGFRSGYWKAGSQAASGFQLQQWKEGGGGAYGDVHGTSYDGETDRFCSGGQKMGGISASTTTTTSGNKQIVTIAVGILPICVADDYQCPESSFITSIYMSYGDAMDYIDYFICSDGHLEYEVQIGVGGTGGNAGFAAGGPFIGIKSSDTSGALAGLTLVLPNGSDYGPFGSSATDEQPCGSGQYLTGFTVPQIWLSSTSVLVASGIKKICGGCPDVPKCAARVSNLDCTCSTCQTDYVLTTSADGSSITCEYAPPTPAPSEVPTAAPTKTKKPTVAPTPVPTVASTKTKKPTAAPTSAAVPTQAPTSAPVLYSCPSGEIIKSIDINYGVALLSVFSFDCTIPSSTMVTTSIVRVQVGDFNSGTAGTVQGPFSSFKSGFYVSSGVTTDGAAGVQFVNNYGTVSPRYGSSYASVTTKKCPQGEVLVGLYAAPTAGFQMVAGNLDKFCAAPPTKNYQCGTGAVIDTITLYSGSGINAISKFTCKDSLGVITSKSVNVGNSTSGTRVVLTGPFLGFNSGFAVSPNPSDAASGLAFVKPDSSTTPTYGTSYTSVSTHACSPGQQLYGLTIGLDSSGTMVAGKMSARCRAP